MAENKPQNLNHVAIIMDGNRRWAREKKLKIFQGHKLGEERMEPIIDSAIEMGIKYLTFWAFSTENWHRSQAEVTFLLNLFRKVLDKKIDRFHQKNVKIKVIGNLKLFPQDIQERTQRWIGKTENNTRITVNLALSYGGRDEIIRAIEKLRANSKFNPDLIGTKLTQEEFIKYLDTAGQPDPDLLIRTGGERRLSGFLLWQLEYTELYFTDVFWPDFTPEEFKIAVNEYFNRQRRFGK
ncbi:di-trans,poly-cis-decaprenylcistransferase [Candidatus Gottesmanbacteria bacterium RIFCSPLOWO2_01_FULL_39_12b]|uniref:Isoprenyl transferase n=1 Tax=Candidatus Gottesmanbacteria bacterium RIFCSPLOWO2_01_FULL_39_12b TaxID=1798388 RepID=A0A1F6AP61_9BACT|nr:MAG: di-trans,poly-cis-decaprenylcistransferase [Candidatus Gottesmanbacteria bacterium RIFCSPLOWO2_01_FULL_39_12b]